MDFKILVLFFTLLVVSVYTFIKSYFLIALHRAKRIVHTIIIVSETPLH